MQIILTALVCLAVLEGYSVISVNLPSYIIPCKKSAIDLRECALRNGQEAIPSLVQGDPKYKIPNMLPLKIEKVGFTAAGNLNLVMTDAELYGLEEAQIKDFKFDENNKKLKINVLVPKAVLLSQYDVSGRILILPIQGHGPANITLIGGLYKYEMDFDSKMKKGEQYLEIKKSTITYDTKRTFFYLGDLFNGDKRLSEEMNKFLNENWREVSNDIAPALTETISQIITSIIANIVKKVPFKNIFLD